ncbi:MAG: putative quinol monooxygenase [Gemmatimonas sp.]|nr:antibiotic biosynthesis monooxygenase [Gemmatimonadaceae bacterium]
MATRLGVVLTLLHEEIMETLALLALLEARPGMEEQLQEFLSSALTMASLERGTIAWYAIKLDASRFAIFDTFVDRNGREAHLSGEIARALVEKADALLATPPNIQLAEIVAAKSPASSSSSRG